jgi:hypothetical protein
MPVAAMLEALQCLRPDHSPNFLAALSSVGGALAGALLATFLIRVGVQASPKNAETSTQADRNAAPEIMNLDFWRDADQCFVVRKSNTQK